MSVIATGLAIFTAAISGGVISKAIDAWSARRTSTEKRAETTSQADATIRTKAIENDAAIRSELWERIEKLETQQAACTRENSELRTALAVRDMAMLHLNESIKAANARADAADKRAAAAETMCQVLTDEIETIRSESVAPPIAAVR